MFTSIKLREMENKKRFISIFLILIMTMSILVGCTSKDVSGNGERKDLVEIVDMANRTVWFKKVENIITGR